MEKLITLGLFVLVVMNAAAIYVSHRKKKEENKPEDGQAMALLLQQINELSRTVDTKMSESNKMMNESVRSQFGESAKLIREVTEGLTKLDETNKQVVSFADQLQSLQDILKNPKQRGILGEYYLETLLKNVLPPGSYQMQYPFPDGTIVDAVVFVKNKIVPIDSKFSLENYNRLAQEKDLVEKARLEKVFENDLKQRIIETSKYIRPQDKTMDFAFMFIPHESLYYDLVSGTIGASEENLIQRAASKYKVITISPTSLFAYLQTVLQGLNALHIEEQAQEIIKRVGELANHLKSFEDYHQKLGNALGTTVNQYHLSNKEFKKIDKDVMRITGTSIGIETLTLDKPSIE
jgi:DNA recombination protein RmuC